MEQRERFDGGAAGELRFARGLALPFQLHIEHEGGQLFAAGAVRDSAAAALGVAVRGSLLRGASAGLEAYMLGSRYVPDRSQPGRTRNGAGFLGRASVEHAGWRGHMLFWRGDDFVKDEGDPNYLSMRRDGTRYRGVRDYAEAGVTRAFQPAPGVTIAASARIHRVENHYEYSYRVIAVAGARMRLR
jgi:hypothetical protein